MIRIFVIVVLAAKFNFFQKGNSQGQKEGSNRARVVSLNSLRPSEKNLENHYLANKQDLVVDELKARNLLKNPENLKSKGISVGQLMQTPKSDKLHDLYFAFVCHNPASCVDVSSFPDIDLTQPNGGKSPVLGGRIFLKEFGFMGDGAEVSGVHLNPAHASDKDVRDFLDTP